MAQTGHPSHDALLAAVPAPGARPDMEQVRSLIGPLAAAMAACPQDPRHHGEGNVWVHTCMVLDELVGLPVWTDLAGDDRSLLFWAAVLHDIAKPATTATEPDGAITARGHSRKGASMAREFLWRAQSPIAWREAICGLIQAHQLPFWLIEREDPSRLLIETSYATRTDLLLLHAEADIRGRLCQDLDAIVENIHLAGVLFDEAACLGQPYPFANPAARVEWATRTDRDPAYAPHETYASRATLLAGLPGSGKDTWIAAHAGGRPVVSLDDIRVEMKVDPRDNQGQVIQEAKERARTHLRAGRDFIWNATNITRQLRTPILGLFRDYGAHTSIVYIEPPRQTLLEQNRGRASAVPDTVIERLAGKLEPPGQLEAHSVTYLAGP